MAGEGWRVKGKRTSILRVLVLTLHPSPATRHDLPGYSWLKFFLLFFSSLCLCVSVVKFFCLLCIGLSVKTDLLDIDGSFGEGGGQILRSSLALSLLTGKPFRLRNIRANRKPKPGLQPQHLMSVRAAAEVGRAVTHGERIGSLEITFEPGQVSPGRYVFPIRTAGATSLVLHTIYLPLAWRTAAPSEVIIEGGTHVSHSPCYEFLDTTWRPYLAMMGLQVELEIKRTGFYPRGEAASSPA